MEDERIVELYWQRNEDAIAQTAEKYGKYLHSLSYNILCSTEDAEECVNDTYGRAWNAMPPRRPAVLPAFLAKIIRRLSIDRWRAQSAEKRGGGEIPKVIDELADCLPAADNVQLELETEELAEMIKSFIRTLPLTEKRIFICRYWYFESVSTISRRCGFTESKVKSILHRTRKKLLEHLRKGGYAA